MTREEVIQALENMGAKKATENVWTMHGHYFQVYKTDEGTYDLREL